MRDIRLIKPDLPAFEAIEGKVREILQNGQITNFGKFVEKFEAAATEYLGAYTVTVSSGTLGLVFALQASGLKKGEKVLLPSFTFMATGQAVLYAGGVPVFVDVTEDLTMCPEHLAEALEQHEEVGAVIPVHMYGLPAQVQRIEQIVESAGRGRPGGISVIYDAAHAFGSELDGARLGVNGKAEVFSLSVTKALVAVEGGLVSSRYGPVIEKIRKMRNYGIEAHYETFWPGMNGKMSEFHAIVGLENLNLLEHRLEIRQNKAAYYREKIKEKTISNPCASPDNVRHTYKDFSVILPKALGHKRDQLVRYLQENGIETRAYFYPPLHEQKYFKVFVEKPLPATSDLSRRVLTLPFYTDITPDEMNYVVQMLAEGEQVLLP